jgi:hypothetical protein
LLILISNDAIHGLTGHREKPWTGESAATPWPKILLPKELLQARILTFGYDADIADWRAMVSKNRISNHSKNLLAALATHRENDTVKKYQLKLSLG